MSPELVITTGITVSLAFFGYIITYVNNLRLSQRSERLERVNRQLSSLYGPLFAMAHASQMAWDAFRKKYRPNHILYFDASEPITEDDLKAWRLWMETVFMPNNLQMYELITSKADLLIESEMPSCLLEFCAHVTAYKAVIKKWSQNDFTEHLSYVSYPGPALLVYTKESFQRLKAEQTRLMGKQKNR